MHALADEATNGYSSYMRRFPAHLVLGLTLLAGKHAAQADARIPPGNAETLAAAPPRPPAGDMETRAAQLFEAVQRDDPSLAEGVFFPKEAFVRVKAMAHPERYFDRLHTRFEADIHALHRALPELAGARFEGLVLSPRGGWVKVGDEGNRLPYWASRHAYLKYSVGGVAKRFEVRVLITWGERWYVIHLSEFNDATKPAITPR